MMPMVFCASLEPCAHPSAPAERICSLPNRALAKRGRPIFCSRPLRSARNENSANSAPMISMPRMKPANGDSTMGMTTLGSSPLPCHQCSAPGMFQMIACQLSPAAANAAPQRPPTSACDDEDGKPHHQVIRFQITPPASAQISTIDVTLTMPVSIRPEAMVLATAVPQSAPIRFMPAASMTAWPGLSTLVATTVAMELAVSWKPLMYSNTSAITITLKTRVSSTARASGILQHDRVDDVAGVAAAVDGFFQDLEQILAQQEAHRIVLVAVHVAEQLEDQPVGLVLQRLQLVVELLHRLELHRAQLADHLLEHLAGLFQHACARDEIDVAEAVADQRIALGEFLDDLGNLVQRAGQGLDVLALQRGHEGVDQRLADFGSELLLALAREAELVQRLDRHAAVLAEKLGQRRGAAPGRGSTGLEQSVKLVALAEDGLERKHAVGPPAIKLI